MNAQLLEALKRRVAQQNQVLREEHRLGEIDLELREIVSEVVIETVENVYMEMNDDVPLPEGRYFYTPKEWSERGESYGCDSLAIVVHDGPPLAPYFNVAYEDVKAYRNMQAALEREGLFAESCTCWYSAIYWND